MLKLAANGEQKIQPMKILNPFIAVILRIILLGAKYILNKETIC